MAKTGTGQYGPVVTDLRNRIAHGELAPGDWLPSEAQIMQEYSVSRYSAREALKRLAADGLIVVVDGRGSHVRTRPDRARHNDTRGLLVSVTDTADVVRDTEYGEWADAEKPSTYRTDAGTDVALTLGIPEHTPLFGVDRLLTRADPPSNVTGRRMMHRMIVPMATCTRAPDLDPFATPDTLYAALHAAGITITATEHVRATTPSPDDATSLTLTPGAAVLVTRRVLRDDHGAALAMEETRRNGEDTQLTYSIVPTPNPHTAPNLAVAAAPTRPRRQSGTHRRATGTT